MNQRITRRAALAGAAAAGLAVPAAAGPCSRQGYGEDVIRAWADRRTLRAPDPALTMEEAICIQDAFVDALRGQAGDPVGWKLGLTSAAMRQQLGVDRPVAGRLLERMLSPEGRSFSHDFGALPIVEADMLVTVRDEWVNDARTPNDVALHLWSLRPFLELPDLMLAEGEPITAETAVAINVGARYGVYGPEIAMDWSRDGIAALARMQVTLTEGLRREVSRAPGSAILGHPLNAVVELVRQLGERGERLRAGDIVSLGSFGAPAVPDRGETYTARYEGVPGAGRLQVSVAFT